ncbi:hypothetical protein BDZ85DRAFT_267667 [Elsinoe ampelina]|uniref:F-box domain-containing protein n=1 Tax=Elsinoe ampelina TaxID=302913 RepID=A0A6A6G452_9PEZI|nr:hypothetical protein BDZ85DRAFT_267667 [Elsinoe ampelina]
MAHRAVPLHVAYAKAPHGWTADAEKKSRAGVGESTTTTPLDSPRHPDKAYLHLPDEILLEIISYLDPKNFAYDYGKAEKQRDLHAFSLVNSQWNAIATPVLYFSPRLEGSHYDKFTRTICPSINLNVRKSPLSSFVRELDLSLLVHQGSKSTTARLLGRTKERLQTFTAPQASFSLNCYPALSKCHALKKLDLSLVSEISSLKTLFEVTAGLESLKDFDLPRSSGFGNNINPATIKWPPNLDSLGLSGGLSSQFWTGQFHLPAGLMTVSITHCPKFDDDCLHAFFLTLISSDCIICHLAFAHLPLLQSDSLDCVLDMFPFLLTLEVSVDYVTPEVLNPAEARIDPTSARYLSDGEEYYSGSEEDEVHLETSDQPDHENRAENVSVPSDGDLIPNKQRRRKPRLRSIVKLEHLELSDSGERDNTEKIEPLDVLMYADDYGMVPRLVRVAVAKSLNWTGENLEGDCDALDDWLVENARARNPPGEEWWSGVRTFG